MSYSWLLILGGTAALFVVGMLVWALQKKLRIFTRGTISFMSVTLMVVTVVSLIDLGNGIRNAERRAKTRAQTVGVAKFLRAWLEDDQETMTEMNRDFSTNASSFDEAYPQAFDKAKGRAEVISIDVRGHYRLRRIFGSAHERRWQAVLITRDGKLIRLGGQVRTSDGEGWQVEDITAGRYEGSSEHRSWSCLCRIDHIGQPPTWINPKYRLVNDHYRLRSQ